MPGTAVIPFCAGFAIAPPTPFIATYRVAAIRACKRITFLTGTMKSTLNLSKDDLDELLQASNGKIRHTVMRPGLRHRKLLINES
jgi:hypothetical protein